MKPTRNKDLNTLLRSYIKRGWTIENRGKHMYVRSPGGVPVVFGRTPSDWRALENVRLRLQRVERGLPAGGAVIVDKKNKRASKCSDSSLSNKPAKPSASR